MSPAALRDARPDTLRRFPAGTPVRTAPHCATEFSGTVLRVLDSGFVLVQGPEGRTLRFNPFNLEVSVSSLAL